MKKVIKARVLPKIKSLGDLRNQCYNVPVGTADRYQRLAMIAASNLGGPCSSCEVALQTLEDNAMEMNYEYEEGVDGEGSVVEEINFVRDIEAEEFLTKRK